MAIIYSRLGEDRQALALFDRAREAYRQMGIEGEPHWLRIELNRAVVLRNLGRFDEAIQSSRMAMEKYLQLGQASGRMHAPNRPWPSPILCWVAITNPWRCWIMCASAASRWAPAACHIGRAFISDCLLQLRRFPEVLEKCQHVRQLFGERGTDYEVGQAILNEASAYIGLGQHQQALQSLDEARHLFDQEGNPVAMADADLKAAQVAILEGQPESGLRLAQRCTKFTPA